MIELNECRPVKVWEELQIAVDQLPPSRPKARKYFRRRGQSDHHLALPAREQVSRSCRCYSLSSKESQNCSVVVEFILASMNFMEEWKPRLIGKCILAAISWLQMVSYRWTSAREDRQ